jgi:PadR family transcriptional regulator, regulatory protein PadR
MIGLEAEAQSENFVEGKVFAQQHEVDRTVSIAIQHETSPVSTLRRMVRNICGHNWCRYVKIRLSMVIDNQRAHLDILLESPIDLPRMSTKEENERIELLQGTLDLLILRTLLLGSAHGHAIAKMIECNSNDVLQVEQGSLYPALHRLIKRGWISAEEGTSENNRRAKFYRLTAKGRRQLAVETNKWDKLAGAIARILRPVEQPGN